MSKNHLEREQKEIIERISRYGENHSIAQRDIDIALKVAYIESSFGWQIKNSKPGSTASGLFSYEDKTWQSYHPGEGEKNSNDNQIAAFFSDVHHYHQRYEKLPENIKKGLKFEEYVYIKHHDGASADDFKHSEGRKIWEQEIKSYDPAWSQPDPSPSPEDTIPTPATEPHSESGSEAILALIESGMAGSLSMQTIAEQLADLSFPQEGAAQTLDRQTLVDAWNRLLENVGEDQLAEIDTVHQSGNRIDVDFQDGGSAALTCLSSGAEVDRFDTGGDLLSNNWWNADGSYGSYSYDADGSFTNTSYAADGSYSTYENDGYDDIVMNNYAADGSYSSYENDGQGSIVINDYAAHGSFSSYTDDGAGNSDLNSYSADGTPLDDGAVFADDDSGYATADASNGNTDADYTADDGFDNDV